MTVLAAHPRTDEPTTISPGPTEQLLLAAARLPAGDPERARLRARAIEHNLQLAYRLAGRYSGRGERIDDLRQVAAVALIKAVDGYDPERPVPFVSYAVPTVLGALKRHFRDHAWAIRVPRSTQQLVLDLPAATGRLAQLLGRSPTSGEVAAHLGVGVGALADAASATHMYSLLSLNAFSTSDTSTEVADRVGGPDPNYAGIDDRMMLGPLVAALAPREQRIITMRYREEMTQAHIAAEIGISQMHVSRLLKQSLAQLKAGLLTPVG